MVPPHGPYGKYCSEHCKQAGQKTELRCDCQHPACRWVQRVEVRADARRSQKIRD